MSMAINVDVPEMGESITEAVLLEWLKGDGDQVTDEESICLLEIDKANVELPAPGAGVLRVLRHEGETIRVGETIARIETSSAEPRRAEPRVRATAPPAPSAGASTATVSPVPSNDEASTVHPEEFSPAVRKPIAEHQIDPAAIRGTGRGGRLSKEDVLLSIEAQQAEQEAVPTSSPAAPPEIRPEAAKIGFDEQGIKRVPMSKIRRRIADNLVAAQRPAAMLTTFNEIDMTAVQEIRPRHVERFMAVHQISLGLMSFFARAYVLALRGFPMVNASLDAHDIVYHQYVHLGITVHTERGLVVPVLRHVEAMSLARTEADIKRLTAATRNGKLGIQELSGGTITIINGGVFGSLLSTPILHPPQSGILGLHAIQKRPVVADDRIVIRPMMYVALSYDH
jgi:2-oxoglutarate dehydrogenase E2 component (dihydrolipoamide succinyltransferase)